MSNERSAYDYEMLKNYNTISGTHAQPWPGHRSQQDMKLQQRTASCHTNSVEHYAPLYGFRTHYDQMLQQRWAGDCNQHPIQPQPPSGPPHPHPPQPHSGPPHPHPPQPHSGPHHPHPPQPHSGPHHHHTHHPHPHHHHPDSHHPHHSEHHNIAPSHNKNFINTQAGPLQNPYGACGGNHSSGPASTPSLMSYETMQMPVGANSNECCCADPSSEKCTSFGCSQGSCPQDEYCFKTKNGAFTDDYC